MSFLGRFGKKKSKVSQEEHVSFAEEKIETDSPVEAVSVEKCDLETDEKADDEFMIADKYYDKAVSGDASALICLKKMAAEDDSDEAQYQLGLCYRDGKGVEQSYTEAMKWLGKAAKSGHKQAQKALEGMHR